MQINGQRALACTREQAWQALNDPRLLQRCIPGCERFEPDGENAYALVVVLGFGPLTTHVRARLQLQGIEAPDRYRLVVESDGGLAGHGTGTADIRLRDAPPPAGDSVATVDSSAHCLLDYNLQVQLGGKIAKWGGRWTDAAAGTVVNGFFRRFEAQLRHRTHPTGDGGDEQPEPNLASTSTGATLKSLFSKAWGRPEK